MEKYRKQFPILKTRTYLNTAASGLLSESLMEWRQEHDLDYLLGGSIFREHQHLFLEGVKSTVADFFGAEQHQVALVPNFSFGMNVLAEGISLKSKVLTVKDEYPSVIWPWKTRGHKISVVNSVEPLEEAILDAFKKDSPDVFAFSLVQYTSGLLLDLDFLKELKNYYPNTLFVADGTQFCGAYSIDFKTSPIDILGASGYKWLLAGYGNGFMLFKDHVVERVFPKTIGFNSTNGSLLKDELRLTDHFEPGHQDTLSYGSLQNALNFLDKIGQDSIQQQIVIFADKMKRLLSEKGLLSNEIHKRESHAPIFNIKGDDELFQKLIANNIICSQRGGGIRISMHWYNTEEDLNRFFHSLS